MYSLSGPCELLFLICFIAKQAGGPEAGRSEPLHPLILIDNHLQINRQSL